MGDPTIAALAPPKAGAAHGLAVLKPDVLDKAHNTTRFVVIHVGEPEVNEHDDKTTIVVTFAHTPGSLALVLTELGLRGANLTVHGDGSSVRTFALVDEMARTLAQLMARADCPAGALNVGGTARTTIRDLASCVIDQAQTGSQVVATDPREDCGANFEPIAFRAPDLSRLAACGVEMPSAPLEAIVSETLALHATRARPASSSACASPAF